MSAVWVRRASTTAFRSGRIGGGVEEAASTTTYIDPSAAAALDPPYLEPWLAVDDLLELAVPHRRTAATLRVDGVTTGA
jgi:hypothetical protein